MSMSMLRLVVGVCLACFVQPKPSLINQCIRLKQIYRQIPPTIQTVENEMCDSPLNVMPCELMGKLSLEYTRQKIMELRMKSNCLGLENSSEAASQDEKCAILESLPQQSVKLATKIFANTPERQLSQKFASAVSRALFTLTYPAYTDLGCTDQTKA
ncbi:unnamed protein product [Cylicocyclus nassatus]|uniref:Uncharacterized protein n=1 Tax=Cylicocyclus nassatus TaxID=53992 RepID=A0AA36DNP0_CYLNA|nr:unnamed protein product [Cylicocyclus nassatus]